MITERRARDIASNWHSGMYSPLYAFCSAGAIVSDTIKEVEELFQIASTGNEFRELSALAAFLLKERSFPMRQNTDGDTIAAKFFERKVSGTAHTRLMDGSSAARLTTDGNTIFSYEWWPVAFWIDDSTIAITTDRYRYENQRGKMINSPTTDAHIGSTHYAAIKNGFSPTEETVSRDFSQSKNREFRLYRKG